MKEGERKRGRKKEVREIESDREKEGESEREKEARKEGR